MTESPQVSCIIPTFNRWPRVSEAVESIQSQTYTERECIVVDDGSTDGTADLLRERYPDVVIIRQENLGVSAARNRGVAESGGEWLAFLDSDDAWHPRKLEAQVQWLSRHPGYRICQTEEIWIRNGRRVNPMHKHRKGEGDCFVRSLELCVISPSTALLKRDLFEAAGGFDDGFPVCEDYDLWLRLTCRETVGLLKEPLVTKYGGHEDQLSRSEPVMDAWRIRAMEKILNSTLLRPDQVKAALSEMARKCRIVIDGCKKRGKDVEAREWEERLQDVNRRYQ